MFTAFKRLLAQNKTGVFINGWEDKSLKKPNIQVHCCFLLPSGAISSSSVAASVRFIYNPQLTATLYTCNAPQDLKLSDQFAVSVTVVEKHQAVPVGPMKKAAPLVPPKKAAPDPQTKKPVLPVNKPVPPVAGNQTAPVNNPIPPGQAKKPVPPGPVKKPVQAKKPVKKPNPVSAKQNSGNKTAQNTIDKIDKIGNRTESVNSSDTFQVDSQNMSLTSRKLLSVNSSVSDNSDTPVKQMVNISVPQAESKPVIKPYSNIICPTDPNAYVMPFEAIDATGDDTITDATGETDLPGEKENGTNKSPVKETPMGKGAFVKAAQGEKNFSFAVCAKIIYGNADVELTIEWMEYYRCVDYNIGMKHDFFSMH